jgi:unsaturated rhamnogalacturonyl hydrolase
MHCRSGAILILLALVSTAAAQTKSISEHAASTAMTALWRNPARNESGYPNRWTYEHGVVLKGIERVWEKTKKKEYLDFIQQNIDHFVDDDGSIRTYSIDNYNLDNILPGRSLLFLYKTTGNEKYRYEYYVGEKVVTNDPKGIGAFLLAATEMESV